RKKQDHRGDPCEEDSALHGPAAYYESAPPRAADPRTNIFETYLPAGAADAPSRRSWQGVARLRATKSGVTPTSEPGDDLHDRGITAETDLVAVAELALSIEADVLLVDEGAVGRSRV